MVRYAVFGWICVLVAALAGVERASAVEVAGLYETEVPVSSKTKPDREAALATALAQVVTKVSGERVLADNPVVARALARAGKYVQQFRYRTVAADTSATGSVDAAREVHLWVRFDTRAVDAMLREAGLAPWGRVRPALLVWTAVEDSGRRVLLAADDETGLVEALRRGASQRGIPLVIPLLDLEDQARVRVSDVWAGFRDSIRAASLRYQSEGVLVGRIYRVLPTLWEANWLFMFDETVQQWTAQSDVIELVLEDGVHAATDILAARFAGGGDAVRAADVALVVSGIRDFRSYSRALRYLSAIDEIGEVFVVGVDAGQVTFQVTARGGAEAVRKVVALGSTFEAAPQAEADGAGLRFRLLP